MRALSFDGKRVALSERDEAPLGVGQARVRVSLAGVCNTDLEIAKGYMGFHGVLGHEFVGEVIEGPEHWLGQRVVSEINFACGKHACERCAEGLGRHCPERSVMGILNADGAFAEQVLVPAANLHAVPAELSNESAVFCEPLAAAFEILEQVQVDDAARVIVLGDGKLGTLIAQVLADSGAELLVVGRHRDRLDTLEALARQHERPIRTLLASDFDPSADGNADLVVEATGSAQGLPIALAATRPRGTLVLKSTHAEQAPVDLAPLVIHEIQLLGSRCGPFAPALAALAARRVDVQPWIEDRYALRDGIAALERAAQPGAGKVLLDCS